MMQIYCWLFGNRLFLLTGLREACIQPWLISIVLILEKG